MYENGITNVLLINRIKCMVVHRERERGRESLSHVGEISQGEKKEGLWQREREIVEKEKGEQREIEVRELGQ